MKNLPLNTLRAFAAVYETGGIRPAGRRLGIAHSSVSRHLKELSAWIEAPLFQPGPEGAGLRLTGEGEALGKSLLAGFSEIDAAVMKVRESKRANTVVISTTASFAMRWLLPRLPQLELAHPSVEVSLIVDQQRQVLREQNIDIAIRMGSGPWPGVDNVPLMHDRLVPVMSPSYWRQVGKPKNVSDLAPLRLLHDRDPNAGWSLWRNMHGPSDLDIRTGSRFTSTDLVLRAAEQGMGVALAREKLASDSLRSGLLVRPLDGICVHLPDAYWLLTQQRLSQRKAVILVRDWLLSQAADKGPD